MINQTAIPTWPVNSPKRWDVLLDAVIVNHANDTIVLPTTDVVGAPTNKAVVLMDSGSSFTSVYLFAILSESFDLILDSLVTLPRRSVTLSTVEFLVQNSIHPRVNGMFLAILKSTWHCKSGK